MSTSLLFRRATTARSTGAVQRALFSSTPARELARIQIVGNLAASPELQETPSGRSLVRYSVASNTGHGEKRTTSWWNVTSFAEGKSRDYLLTVPKGSTVWVEGNIVMDQWTSPEGQPRTGVKIYQTALEVVKKGQQAENQEGQDGQAEGYAQ